MKNISEEEKEIIANKLVAFSNEVTVCG